jgi:hypothetical protein
MAGQQRVERLGLHGEFADLLPDAVSALVGDAELPLQFFARNAVTRGAEQIHGIEPANQRGAGIVQHGVGGRRDLKQAVRAGINPALCQLVELRAFYAASRAVHFRAAKAHRHDVFKAGVVIRKPREELADWEGRAGRG